MQIVYVLGNGQLGRMLRQAGEPLGIKVILLDFNSITKIKSICNCVITNEIEYWPEKNSINKFSQHNSFINKDILIQITDRLNQKKLLNKLNLNTASWQLLSNPDQWIKIFKNFNEPIVVKLRNGSYDGIGQYILYQNLTNIIPESYYNNKCIVEKFINFTNEISLIGARSFNQNIVFYPITKTFHQKGILRATVSSNKNDFDYQQVQAESMLKKIMNKLNYIGIMAMECFIDSNGLLFINELAPRVHNSGHWTQNGASINQFELHLRAILNLSIPEPIILNKYSVMINLIGIKINYEWLKYPLVHLHWYDKEIRNKRKVGHLNLSSNNLESLKITLSKLIDLLPKEYEDSITWSINQIN